MSKHLVLAAALSCIVALAATPADAHAHLKHAEPGQGATVASPHAITLEFSEGVVPRFSSIAVADATGHDIHLDKATNGAKPTILVAPISGKLPPGTYVVTWRAVSIDTHRTQGTFRFSVAP